MAEKEGTDSIEAKIKNLDIIIIKHAALTR
jgi:hypothetical protein